MGNWLRQEWITRLNWIGTLTDEQRHFLLGICALNGRHTKSGEMFLTATPIHVCYVCAAEFYEGEKVGTNG